MARNGNGSGQTKGRIPLTLVQQDEVPEITEETFIVVGEAGEDVAFEMCEDLDIALGVCEAMIEDGFQVRLFQATEIEVVVNDETPPNGTKRTA